MARKPRLKRAEIVDANDGTPPRFSRVVVVIVALENYRKPSNGDALPSVAFAHADADGIRDAVLEIFKDMSAGDVEIEVMKDTDASLIAVKDHLAYTIRNLDDDALFIFYYAGHGFHGAGGNRLSSRLAAEFEWKSNYCRSPTRYTHPQASIHACKFLARINVLFPYFTARSCLQLNG